MIHDTGNQLLNRLERSIGKLALPQILRWIAGFQVLTWGLSLISSDFPAWIVFDREAIFAGEVWRLFSWIFHPISQGASIITVLFVVIAALFMFFINDSLEREWDSFRLNAYVISTIFCLGLAGFLPTSQGAGPLLNSVFYSSVFLAFASLFPNHIIHLFAIIPIKAKWLGWANAAILVGMSILSPLGFGPIAVLGMIPFMLVFFPTFSEQFKQRGEAAVRRHRFEESSSAGGDAFHECASCGATEISNPEREFRVSADGEEYCSDCRSKKQSEETD